ncbi:MAG: DUF192 domain-containing protein [Deltaproteobacteria bacterium]|nr:DUF192 domain-containing protein [Deltaproteobacteria bacterium]
MPTLVVAVVACVPACRDAGTRPAPAPAGSPKEDAVSAPSLREVKATFTTPSGARSTFTVEVVDTPATRERGLMYRKSLAPDRGMVFVFPKEEVQTFWMKNTYVALDMVFVGADFKVVGVVEDARPLTLDMRSVPVPSRYVIELNAHVARARGIGPGTRLSFEPPL